MSKPLEDRPGFETDEPTDDLARDLGKLAKRHGLLGVVLVSFKGGRIGTNFSGEGDLMYRAMDELSSKILTAIDDGKFDPSPTLHN